MWIFFVKFWSIITCKGPVGIVGFPTTSIWSSAESSPCLFFAFKVYFPASALFAGINMSFAQLAEWETLKMSLDVTSSSPFHQLKNFRVELKSRALRSKITIGLAQPGDWCWSPINWDFQWKLLVDLNNKMWFFCMIEAIKFYKITLTVLSSPRTFLSIFGGAFRALMSWAGVGSVGLPAPALFMALTCNLNYFKFVIDKNTMKSVKEHENCPKMYHRICDLPFILNDNRSTIFLILIQDFHLQQLSIFCCYHLSI